MHCFTVAERSNSSKVQEIGRQQVFSVERTGSAINDLLLRPPSVADRTPVLEEILEFAHRCHFREMAPQVDRIAARIMRQQFCKRRRRWVGRMSPSPQQKIRISSGECLDDELKHMASIEQEFIGSEYPCIYFNDLHRIQFEILAFIANKRIKTKRIRLQRHRDHAAKLHQSFAVDVVRYVFIIEILRNFTESILPFFARSNRLLRGNTKKIRWPCWIAREGHTNLSTIRYEMLGNVRLVPFSKKMAKRVLVANGNDPKGLLAPDRFRTIGNRILVGTAPFEENKTVSARCGPSAETFDNRRKISYLS